MIHAETRLCASCKAILPASDQAQVCPKCGQIAIARHADWDPRLKYFLTAAYFAKHSLGNARTEQSAWEDSLRALIAGAGGVGPSPFAIKFDAPALECYPVALKLALHWRATGAPIVPDLLDVVGRSSGLIAASFPTAKAS